MNQAQFLALLPIVADRGWSIKPGNAFRDKDGRCPICALANEVDPVDHTSRLVTDFAVPFLGLSPKLADDIVQAADNEEGHSKKLRAAMIRTLIG